MSRDRLAAMRAQQANERSGGRQQQQAQQYGSQDDYAPNDDGYSIPQPRPANHHQQASYGYDESGYAPQPSGYTEQAGYGDNGYNPSGGHTATGYAPRRQQQPQRPQYSVDSYVQAEDEPGQLDEDARGQRARRRSVASPVRGYSGNPNTVRQQRQTASQRPQQQQPQQQQMRELTPQRMQPPPQQQQNNRTFQDQYGSRNDDRYYQQNASSAALNEEDESPYDEKQDDQSYVTSGYPPQSRGNTQHQTYEVGLPRGQSQPQPQRRSMQHSAPMGYSNSVPQTPAAAQGANVVTDAPQIDMSSFFEEIQSVRDSFRTLEQYIGMLDQLHSRSLNTSGAAEAEAEREQVAVETRKLTNSLRQRIKDLQETTRIRTHGQAETDRQTRKVQITGLKEKFLAIVQSYQSMEMKNRDKSKQRIERQYQIVKPNATPEEIRQVVDGGQEVQIFAQALRNTHRVGQAQNVLNEVQTRHEAIQKIERTLVELFQMMQDMAVMVEEQDEQIIHIEQTAEAVAVDMEEGHKQIVQAKESAKGARKKRKICFCIIVVLLLVIGGVVAYVVVKVVIPKVNESKASAAATPAPDATKTITATAKSSAKRSIEERYVLDTIWMRTAMPSAVALELASSAQGVQSQPYQQQQQAPYSGQGAGNYEMQQVGGAPVGAVGGFGSGAPALGPGANQQAFFGEIDLIANSLQQLKNNITQIDTLHNTVLNSTTNEARQEAAQRDLEQMTAETSKMTNSIKLRIKNLSELNDKQQHTLSPSDLNTQRMQVAALKQRFMNYIQEYREVEQKSRDKYRARMERQYKIVKPDATQEEIKYAMDTDQGSQVFASALTQSTRYADARNAYREVQERHEDIKKIAQTMQELQQLFNDMAMLVERQDEQIQTIEATAVDVETNMAAANVQIDKGVKS
ncbi:hypothetical protein EMMF5_002233 [Cystobasidiomycetes sp. EMM_F5]